ncbi:MAG TPA: preprotein translocase subunit SecA [Candidatus Taylorbacteria bacterium]|nr:MAG: Protein translocase subunit SecA [Parcubacteria group bacterium GW2011_GWA2_47_64]KKU96688.1 MAG: Protein translocase subunit SecA [Parcubacteria group bacterium GW2011_GWC2_48_17]HBV00780.1 preprotein translocase subunit SecA [Candidatus Taylorbacteria bacterium]
MFDRIKKLFGDDSEAKLKPLYANVQKINSLEAGLLGLSGNALKEKTTELKARVQKGESLDDILPEAFALVREAARRTLGERHFDVQLLGGHVLHNHGIAEMRTGEGKTLVATLPSYLNALAGKGVHIVTVNDYLSRRDAVWMGQIHHLLGLSVGVINHDSSFIYDPAHSSGKGAGGISNFQFPISKQGENLKSENPNKDKDDQLDKTRDELGSFRVVHEFLKPCTRREAYAADITYGTNNEFGFDYLRDNLEYSPERLRQRDFNYAIVDEVDSILIDEARTPLIISAPTGDSGDLYARFAQIVRGLERDTDFTVDEKQKAIQLTPAGIEKAEKALGVDNLYTEKGIKYVHHLETAVRAKALFHLDKEYVVRNGEIVIVDEFTGRMMPGRRWSEGLHQAIEAKEGVKVQKESRTFASITFQNYFRMYKKLAGMTGTAKTSSEEFYKVYGLDVVSIPTNKPIARADRNDQIFQTEKGKFKAIAKKVAELNQREQPVLIGTVSIEKNEVLSEYLRSVGVPHEVLNAKNHEREGEIIAQAGRKGAVTVATNMAGRGVDIKLGGNPQVKEDAEAVKSVGGLFVLGTERHEARRIDNQLRGRSGRQGDPGETQFFVSMEDTLMRVFAADTIKNMMGRFGIPEDEPIENRIITRSLETAQTKIEGFNFDARKHVLEYDNVLNHQRSVVYERRRNILVGGGVAAEDYLTLIGAGNEAFQKSVEEKKKQLGDDFYPAIQRLILQTIDLFWVEHLEVMDYLRGSVNLRAYGQRDPLVEYKKEGLQMFKEMEENIVAQVMNILPRVGGPTPAPEQIKLQEVHEQAQLIGSGDEESDAKHRGNVSRSNVPTNPDGSKLGRNDPCYCGVVNTNTGKVYKYKQCGLINAPYHRRA